MRFSILVALLLHVGIAGADWTGVAMEFSDYDSDWAFAGGDREAQHSSVSFQIEEKTDSGLRVGASIGYVDLRVVAATAAETRKFDGEFFSVYLRQPFSITDAIALHALLSYRYTSGNESGVDADAQIDWNETTFELGASLRFAEIRMMPFTSYIDVDGDISDDSGTAVFDMQEPASQGLRFDYFVDSSAFVRLELVSGGRSGGYLKFMRRY